MYIYTLAMLILSSLTPLMDPDASGARTIEKVEFEDEEEDRRYTQAKKIKHAYKHSSKIRDNACMRMAP